MRRLAHAIVAALLLAGPAFGQVSNPPAGFSANILAPADGGTGINNGSNTLTLGGVLATTGIGAATLALPSSAATFTFPSASKTLMASDYTNGLTLTANALLTGGGSGAAPNAVAITGLVQGNGASAPAAYGGSGTCSSNQWITALSAAGAKTCTQPATTNLSDVVSAGSWTPADASGAGLTFTSVNASYTRLGNLVFAYFILTYPSTANGSNASISGLPVTSASATYTTTPSECRVNGIAGKVPEAIVSANATSFVLNDDNAGGTALTNALLSTLSVSCMLIYPAS
jgi:hypothetical protein